MTTPEQRARWRKLAEAATSETDYSPEFSCSHPLCANGECGLYADHCADEEFADAARSAVPALIDDVERLESELAQLRRDFAVPDDDAPRATAELVRCGTFSLEAQAVRTISVGVDLWIDTRKRVGELEQELDELRQWKKEYEDAAELIKRAAILLVKGSVD